MSGFWYSSPIRFQYAVLANSRSYGSRSFCSWIFCGSADGWAAALAVVLVDQLAVRDAVGGCFAFGRGLVLILRDLDERHRVGVDHAQRRLRAQLAPQQAHRFLVGVELVVAAGDEAGDEHALERGHVELGPDRRFDRDLEQLAAAGHGQHGAGRRDRTERETVTCPSETRGH